MSTSFKYEAVDSQDRFYNGEIVGDNEIEIANLLKKRGLTIISIEENRVTSKLKIKIGGKVGLKEVILLTTYLATMIKAGMPLIAGVDVLISDARNGIFKRMLESIRNDLEKGKQLSESLARYPNVFDQSFIGIVKSGESTGQLNEVFTGLSEKLKRDLDTQAKIKNAMIYPSIIIFSLFLVGAVMIIFVLPKLMASFDQLNINLPFVTRQLVNLSKFASQKPLVSLGILITIILGLIIFLRSKSAKLILRGIGMQLPGIKGVYHSVDLAKLTSTLSILLKTGVPIERSLLISADIVYDPQLKKVLKESVLKVQKGVSIATSLRQEKKIIPEIMIKIIQIGEETGSLEQTLKTLGDTYNQDVDNMLKSLTTLIEPVLMLFVGIVVGGFVLSIIGPIFQIVSKTGG